VLVLVTVTSATPGCAWPDPPLATVTDIPLKELVVLTL
jgi:hypothetical protein